MNNSPLTSLQQRVDAESFPHLRALSERSLQVFISFDLCNSTLLKTVSEEWPVIFVRFYELIQACCATSKHPSSVWKHVGDEVLFRMQIDQRAELEGLLRSVLASMHRATETLKRDFPKCSRLIGIKAAIWSAYVRSHQGSAVSETKSSSLEDISVRVGPSLEDLREDFLGPNVDIGFRISKHSFRNRIVVSAELARLLQLCDPAACNPSGARMRIVDFEVLKGIWGGRPYPIIWYEEEWEHIAETFEYDERLSHPVARRLCAGQPDPYEIERLDRIIDSLGLSEAIEVQCQALQRAAKRVSPGIQIDIPLDRQCELHLVAVCFSPEGKVLLAQRPGTKRRCPNLYEFGCGQLRFGESFKTAVLRAYKEDFGAVLRLPEPLLPIGCYELRDRPEGGVVPGLVFFGEICNATEIEKVFHRSKHSKVVWEDPKCVSLRAEECVPELDALVHTAFHAWSTWRGKQIG